MKSNNFQHFIEDFQQQYRTFDYSFSSSESVVSLKGKYRIDLTI